MNYGLPCVGVGHSFCISFCLCFARLAHAKGYVQPLVVSWLLATFTMTWWDVAEKTLLSFLKNYESIALYLSDRNSGRNHVANVNRGIRRGGMPIKVVCSIIKSFRCTTTFILIRYFDESPYVYCVCVKNASISLKWTHDFHTSLIFTLEHT